MKCGFCGKELTEGAEFCPECGMILSLGGVTNEPDEKEINEVEIPEYTPNVFRAMDFEEVETEPAMELEITDVEETAEVVEIIPEYTEAEEIVEAVEVEDAAEAEEEEAVEADVEQVAVEEEEIEEFAVPEYDPNATVSDEFLQQVANEEAEKIEEAKEEPAEEAEDSVESEETAEEDFVPPEYEGELVSEPVSEIYEIITDEDEVEEIVEAYPVYDDEEISVVPEEELTEEEGLFAAIFENAEAEKLEDITPDAEKGAKKPKNNFGAVIAIIVVLAGVVFGGAYAFRNVLPKIVDTSNTTTAATDEKVDGTTEKTTTEKATDKKETTTKKDEVEESTTKETTTEASTEATTETTTKATTETTTEAETDSGEVTVAEPSAYDLDMLPFFPKSGDISIKATPSATGVDMIIHPFGYPVFAYAKQGSYYYVHSAYHDFMGWVYEKDLEAYVEGTTEAAETEESTEPSQEVTEPEETVTELTEEVTQAPEQESDSTSYVAMIGAAEGLNFRTGPGYDYSAEVVVPGGFYVRVTAVSEEDPAWVYVTVEDDRYPYGTPGGWVLVEYLI